MSGDFNPMRHGTGEGLRPFPPDDYDFCEAPERSEPTWTLYGNPKRSPIVLWLKMVRVGIVSYSPSIFVRVMFCVKELCIDVVKQMASAI